MNPRPSHVTTKGIRGVITAYNIGLYESRYARAHLTYAKYATFPIVLDAIWAVISPYVVKSRSEVTIVPRNKVIGHKTVRYDGHRIVYNSADGIDKEFSVLPRRRLGQRYNRLGRQ